MTKTWTAEDIQNARAESVERSKAAEQKGKRGQILQLKGYIDSLPHCYDSLKDAMYDFWPDFSWTKERCITQVRMVMMDDRFPAIHQSLLDKYSFDMRQHLTAGA